MPPPQPNVVRGIAQAYVRAGSDIVETNSFGGTRFSSSHTVLPIVLLSSIGQRRGWRKAMGERALWPPRWTYREDCRSRRRRCVGRGAATKRFRSRRSRWPKAGADAICIETMSSLAEAVQAIRAAKENTDLPVICTFTFESGLKGFRTMMGVKPARAALESVAAGADVVGANCGNGIANMIEITRPTSRCRTEYADSDSRECRLAGDSRRDDLVRGDAGVHVRACAELVEAGAEYCRWLLWDHSGRYRRYGEGGSRAAQVYRLISDYCIYLDFH